MAILCRPVASALLAASLIVLVVPANSQGVTLTLDSDMIFHGNGGQNGQLTCGATGNGVIIDSVTIIGVDVTGKGTDLLTVTADNPSNSVSLDGMLGNGTLQDNSGYLFLNKVDGSACESSYFLCEVHYLKSGERGRAVAIASPGQPQSGQSGPDMSAHTRALVTVEEKSMDLSAALEMLNQSYSSLLGDMQEGREANARLAGRVSQVEANISSMDQTQSCEPCSDVTESLMELKSRLDVLENSTSTAPTESTPHVCDRTLGDLGYVTMTHHVLGKQFVCDTSTDGGGWIVIQRRVDGSVDFNRNWDAYKNGFGDMEGSFWLGNEFVYNITNTPLGTGTLLQQYELRVDFRSGDQDYYALSSPFKLENEADNYRIRLGIVSGSLPETPDEGLQYHNNRPFSTIDRINTVNNCPQLFSSGFWFGECSRALLNSPFENGVITSGWYRRSSDDYLAISSVEMKIRMMPTET